MLFSWALMMASCVVRVAFDAVRARGHVPTLEVRAAQRSASDPFVKLALATHDGHVIEAVGRVRAVGGIIYFMRFDEFVVHAQLTRKLFHDGTIVGGVTRRERGNR